MATKYFVVMTAWPIGQAVSQQPTSVQRAIVEKCYSMVSAGKAVRPECPYKDNVHSQEYHTGAKIFPTHSDPVIEHGRPWFTSWSMKHKEEIMNGAVGTISTDPDDMIGPSGLSVPFANDTVTEPRGFRIFTSEAAANEFIDFILSLGAVFSIIMTQEEIDAMNFLPDDSVIDQYVGLPS